MKESGYGGIADDDSTGYRPGLGSRAVGAGEVRKSPNRPLRRHSRLAHRPRDVSFPGFQSFSFTSGSKTARNAELEKLLLYGGVWLSIIMWR